VIARTDRRRHGRTATARRRHAPCRGLAVLGAGLLAGLVLTGVLVLSDDSAPSRASAIAPLRVTSGTEIATGFGVGDDRVVTVAHVLGGAVKVGGAGARVVRVDRRADLALLRVPGIAAAAPEESDAGAGEDVRVLRLRGGHSDSLWARVRRPIVAHVQALGARRAVTRPALELDARVAAGDSGAPVMSRSGALVGVVFATSARREDTAYAVAASAVSRLLPGD
jgi:S1-C subfamily serine protease